MRGGQMGNYEGQIQYRLHARVACQGACRRCEWRRRSACRIRAREYLEFEMGRPELPEPNFIPDGRLVGGGSPNR